MPSTDRGAAGVARRSCPRSPQSGADHDKGHRGLSRQARLDASRAVAQAVGGRRSRGRGVLVKVLRVGVDGTDKEINAAEYGAALPDTTSW